MFVGWQRWCADHATEGDHAGVQRSRATKCSLPAIMAHVLLPFVLYLNYVP